MYDLESFAVAVPAGQPEISRFFGIVVRMFYKGTDMWNMNDLRSAKHVKDCVVALEFDDGMAGEVDLSHFIHRGPVIEPLADVAFFRQFKIEGGTLAWPNGADIAPERLYEMLAAVNTKQ